MITLGQIHAQKILSGRYSKIHTKFDNKSWKPLADFNAAGLVTFDCQDARNHSQRTYIDGFMNKHTAPELSDAFNTSSNLISIVIPTVDTWHRCSRIAMCTERAIIENQIPMHVDKEVFLHFAHQVGLSVEMMDAENTVIFRCFDPVWGRSACDKNGLYVSVRNSMHAIGLI